MGKASRKKRRVTPDQVSRMIDRQSRWLASSYLKAAKRQAAPTPWVIHCPKIDGLQPYLKARLDATIVGRALEILEAKGHRPPTIVDSDI